MKKILSIFFFYIIIVQLYSQTPYKNYQKYQYLRERLRNDFVIVDNTNRQGTNIPANSRNRWGGWLDYGENTMIECIFPYMTLLATEYAKNKKYGLNNTQTLNELSYLLLAIERIDLNAEKFFRAELDTPPLDTLSPSFWTDIDNYIDYNNDLNGFFLRNDADSHYDTFDENGNLIYEDNRFYFSDSTRYIFNYNNSQLQNVDYYDGTIVKASSVFNRQMFGYTGIATNNRSVLSKDEVAWLYLGLALVSKLVDDNRLFTDTQGEQVTIRHWCSKIALRTLYALHNENCLDNWQIVNPVTDEEVYERVPGYGGMSNGGNTYAMSAGFQLATMYIIGQENISNPELFSVITDLSGFYDFFLRLNIFETVYDCAINAGINKTAYFIPYNLGVIAGWITEPHIYLGYEIISNSFLFKNTLKLMKKETQKVGKITYEYHPLFYSILHDVDIENNWIELNNFLSYYNYVDSIEMLLNVIPECGSYVSDDKGAFSDYYWINARYVSHNWLNENNFCVVYPYPTPNTDEDFYKLKINSNMDYMILYNLYYLLLNEEYLNHTNTANTNIDYPHTIGPITIGSNNNPLIKYGNYFQMDNTIYNNGNVRLVADNYIKLLPGFEVKNGGYFEGKIGEYKPECDFNFTGTHPCPIIKSNNHLSHNNLTHNKIKVNKGYKIYPNPVSNILTIEFDVNFNPNLIKLYDYSGKLIKN